MRIKLETLPQYALYELAIKKGIDKADIINKDKMEIIGELLLCSNLEEYEIDEIVSDYIYGNRVAFTLWTINNGLDEDDYKTLDSMINQNIEIVDSAGRNFRNMKIENIRKHSDRLEVSYVYSKKIRYTNEQGKYTETWGLHNGCVWLGIEKGYLACISKHEQMKEVVIKHIANRLGKTVNKITPPRKAIERFKKSEVVSRIVWQGFNGEKSTFSNKKGLTEEQEDAIQEVKGNAIDVAGSFLTELDKDLEGTIKYNTNTGSISINKNISEQSLFKWTSTAINVIFEEIEKLKGERAEKIFKEVGKTIKWSVGLSKEDEYQMNWFLTIAINALDVDDNIRSDVPEFIRSILENDKLFMKVPRLYCNVCQEYEALYCEECCSNVTVKYDQSLECDCGNVSIQCENGHNDYCIKWWYIPTERCISMINYNIIQIYDNRNLDYNFCILHDRLELIKGKNENNGSEIYFDEVECFKTREGEYIPPEHVWKMAVRLNEKCDFKCTNANSNLCLTKKDKVCLPKVFYSILPKFKPQPHKGLEYGDVSGEIEVGRKRYEMKGIIKKNSEHGKKDKNKELIEDEILKYTSLLSTRKEGQEIIRQFVEQGINDARCDVIAIIVPQYIDAGLKGSLRHLAKLAGKYVMFIELNEVCKLLEMNDTIDVNK